MPAAKPIYIALMTCVVENDDGITETIREKERVRGDHKAVKDHPEIFIADGATSYEIEVAKAALLASRSS